MGKPNACGWVVERVAVLNTDRAVCGESEVDDTRSVILSLFDGLQEAGEVERFAVVPLCVCKSYAVRVGSVNGFECVCRWNLNARWNVKYAAHVYVFLGLVLLSDDGSDDFFKGRAVGQVCIDNLDCFFHCGASFSWGGFCGSFGSSLLVVGWCPCCADAAPIRGLQGLGNGC